MDKDRIKKLFGERLNSFRKTTGTSREEFADKLGIHENTLGRIERGETFITVEVLSKLNDVYGLNPTEFFSFESNLTLEELHSNALKRLKILKSKNDKEKLLLVNRCLDLIVDV